MYRGLIQEAEVNFASEGLCSFVVEGCYGSSSAPAVAPDFYVSSNQVAVVVGIDMVVLTVAGTVLVGSNTTLVDAESVALGP